jgi:hypothetical protein
VFLISILLFFTHSVPLSSSTRVTGRSSALIWDSNSCK